jgi:hypothetical protein
MMYSINSTMQNFNSEISYILGSAKMTKVEISSSEQCKFQNLQNLLFLYSPKYKVFRVEILLVEYIIINIHYFFQIFWKFRISFFKIFKKKGYM